MIKNNNNQNKKLIQLVLENKRDFKTHKLISFLYKLIEEKKIYEVALLKNYVFVYYNVTNMTFQNALRILKENNLVRVSRNLSDCRRLTVFLT